MMFVCPQCGSGDALLWQVPEASVNFFHVKVDTERKTVGVDWEHNARGRKVYMEDEPELHCESCDTVVEVSGGWSLADG